MNVILWLLSGACDGIQDGKDKIADAALGDMNINVSRPPTALHDQITSHAVIAKLCNDSDAQLLPHFTHDMHNKLEQ